MSDPACGRLSLSTKLGYGVGDMGANLVFQTVLIFLLFYLTDVFGLAAPLAGAIFFIAKLWDGITDPVMGYISDRTRTRWGSKRPYLLFGAAPLGLSFFLLFASPPLDGFWKGAYALLFFLMVCTFYTVVNIPYGALTAALTMDAHERSSLTGYRMFFAIFGTLVVAGATLPLVRVFESPVTGFRVTAGLFGAGAMVLTWVTFFTVKEPACPTVQESYNLSDIFKVIRHNPPFIVLSVGMILHLAAVGILASMVNFFFKYNMGQESFASVALLCIFASAALALPLWVWVARVFSKRATFNLGMGLLAVTLISLYFINKPIPALLIPVFILAGIGISTIYFSPMAMIPDTVEYSEWKIGLRREGVLYGVFYFGQKLAAALAGFISGQGLGLFGFQANQVQNAQVLFGIRFLMTGVPVILIVIGIIVICFYPIDQKLHDRMLREINGAQAIPQ